MSDDSGRQTASLTVQGKGADIVPVWNDKNPEAISADARAFVRASKADATIRAYQSDMRAFTAWCIEHRRQALPASPATVADYLAAEAGAGCAASKLASAAKPDFSA